MKKSMYVKIEQFMHDCMKDSAHDSEHIYRVLHQSLHIASKLKEKVNFDILIAACLLHDIGRGEQYKNHAIDHAQAGGLMAKEFLLNNGWSEQDAEHVHQCIQTHRFRGNNVPATIEAQILFDSDKLDVSGCLGIARTLMYKGIIGGSIYTLKNGKICYGMNKEDDESFLKEYNYKLKIIYDKFYTKAARKIAKKQKKYAQFFYDKLVDQITAVNGGEAEINMYIDE